MLNRDDDAAWLLFLCVRLFLQKIICEAYLAPHLVCVLARNISRFSVFQVDEDGASQVHARIVYSTICLGSSYLKFFFFGH